MKKIHHKKVLVLCLVAVLMLFGAFTVTTGVAHAATCATIRCNNTNPYTTGCSSGSYYVVDSRPVYHRYYNASTGRDTTDGVVYGYIQLWYSSSCGTNWARYSCSSSCISGYAVVEWADPSIDPNDCGIGNYLESGYGSNGTLTHQEYLPTTKAEATFTSYSAEASIDYTKSYYYYAGYTGCV